MFSRRSAHAPLYAPMYKLPQVVLPAALQTPHSYPYPYTEPPPYPCYELAIVVQKNKKPNRNATPATRRRPAISLSYV